MLLLNNIKTRIEISFCFGLDSVYFLGLLHALSKITNANQLLEQHLEMFEQLPVWLTFCPPLTIKQPINWQAIWLFTTCLHLFSGTDHLPSPETWWEIIWDSASHLQLEKFCSVPSKVFLWRGNQEPTPSWLWGSAGNFVVSHEMLGWGGDQKSSWFPFSSPQPSCQVRMFPQPNLLVSVLGKKLIVFFFTLSLSCRSKKERNCVFFLTILEWETPMYCFSLPLPQSLEGRNMKQSMSSSLFCSVEIKSWLLRDLVIFLSRWIKSPFSADALSAVSWLMIPTKAFLCFSRAIIQESATRSDPDS